MSIKFTDPFVARAKEEAAKTFSLGAPIKPEEIQKIVDKNVGKVNPDANDPRGKDQRGVDAPSSPKTALKEAKAARKEAVKSLNVGGSTDLASAATAAVDQLKSTLADSLDIDKIDIGGLFGDIGGDLEGLVGDLTEGLSDLEKAAKGFFDNPAGAISQMSGDLVSQLSNQAGPLFGQMGGMIQQLGGDPQQFLNDLVDAGLVSRGTTLSGLTTVPSAIQMRGSDGRNVGSDGRVSGRTNTTGNAGNKITGGQPGRTAGTRVQCAFSDPKKVPRQVIVDALDAACRQLDIVVQITPQGGWVGRSSGTQNHPTGWAADFQVVATSGGLILPTADPVLYGRIGAILHGYAISKGVTAGIGQYPNFMHYDTYPPRSGYSPIETYVRWGSGWNMNSYISRAKDEGYTYKPGAGRTQIASAGPGGQGGV